MRTRKTLNWVVPALAAGTAVAVGTYVTWARPKMLSWGASEEEVRGAYPGDDLLKNRRLESTHAITIRASAAQIWPWLVQMGQGRGGFYTYDWIENLMGLKIHSAERVLDEYQDLKVGDLIPLAPGGFGIPVGILEPERALVLHGDSRLDRAMSPLGDATGQASGEYMAAVWGFHLIEREPGITRLVERWQADWNPSMLNAFFYRVFLEPGAFVLQRGTLLGLKRRIESSIERG